MIKTFLVLVALLVLQSASVHADLAELEEAAMRAALQRIAPSVVRIQTVGGLSKVGRVTLGTGPCSGLVVSEDGYIISSSFNFAREPATILVEMSDGTSQPARLVAQDHNRSLVLLKVDLPEGTDLLTVPEAVPDNEVRVGAWAIAVGRTFDLKQPNMSVGIISAINRVWGKAVQTDAKISPNNYGGPLVDLRGRVFGVLAPLSPQSNQAVAGAGWYDSGIGFAVPLSQIERVLDRLKKGEDLHAGVMGISLRGKDQFGTAPVIAAAQYGSPAHDAGLKADDKIIEANGRPVASQAQLKHVISSLYAGDTVEVAVLRGKERMEFELELTDKLAPFAHAFLGVLPRRDAKDLVIRYVYPDSAAAEAGLQVGDRITKVGEKKIEKRADMYDALATLMPGQETKIAFRRDDEQLKGTAKLGRLPETVPDELPSPRDPSEPEVDPAIDVGAIEIKFPEFTNECFAYVPENYDPSASYGVVVWLGRPGEVKQDELIKRWKDLCEQHDLILLVPKARDATKWQRDEVEFLARALERIREEYEVDEARTVAHGYQTGAAMAFIFGTSDDGNVHGIAAVQGIMPGSVRPAPLEPTERAAIYWAFGKDGKNQQRVASQIKGLRDQNYPVTEKQLDGGERYLTAAELGELVRWIDTLDRF